MLTQTVYKILLTSQSSAKFVVSAVSSRVVVSWLSPNLVIMMLFPALVFQDCVLLRCLYVVSWSRFVVSTLSSRVTSPKHTGATHPPNAHGPYLPQPGSASCLSRSLQESTNNKPVSSRRAVGATGERCAATRCRGSASAFCCARASQKLPQ